MGGGGAYIKWNGPIDLTDNSFDINYKVKYLYDFRV